MRKEENRNIKITPQKLWLRIVIVIIVMVAAYYTSFLIKPAAELLNVDLKDFSGFGFKIKTGVLILTFGYAISQFLLIYLVSRIFHKRPVLDLGFRGPILKHMAIGILIGLLFTGIYYFICAIIGGDFKIVWAVPSDVPVLSLIFKAVFVLIFILTINSLKEELVFRAYPLEQFMDKPRAMIISIVLVSIFFSGIHAMYLPFSLGAFVHRFEIALLFSFAYYYWRSIWFISGIHSGANMIAFVFFSGKWQVGGLWMVSFSETPEIFNIILYTIIVGITMLILYQFRPTKRAELLK